MKEVVQKDWAHLIELFLNKGEEVSPVAFCKKYDVSIYEMDLHYKEFLKNRRVLDQEFTCVEITGSERKSPYLILDVNSVRIKVNQGFDHSLLREILEVIKC